MSKPNFHPVLCWLTAAALICAAGCKRADYDEMAFKKVQLGVADNADRLPGMALKDALSRLQLESIKWDDGNSPNPTTLERVYHFDGFYLLMNLRKAPPASAFAGMPGMERPAGATAPRDTWFLSETCPALHIDRIHDPAVRMSNYWYGIKEGQAIKEHAAPSASP